MRAPGGLRPVCLGIGVVLVLLGVASTSSAQLVANPQQVIFDETMVGRSSPFQQVAIQFWGFPWVSLLGFSVVGPAAGDFSLTPPACQPFLTFGDFCVLQLRFTPTQAGRRQATLRVDNDYVFGPLLVPLDAMGLPAAPLISVFPASVNFPDQPLLTQSGPRTVTLFNGGLRDLHISSIVKGGSHPVDFQKAAGCEQAVIPPNGQCVFNVFFTPQQVGNRSAVLWITSDSGGFPGTVSSLPLSGRTPQAAISLSPSPLNFGTRSVGTFGTGPQFLSITNTGSATLVVTGLSPGGGANPGDFVLPGTLSCTVAPGQSCSFPINFAPTSFGARSATVSVLSNVPGPPATATLTGSGTFPATTGTPPTDDHRFLSAGSTLTPVCSVAGSPASTLSVGVTRFVGAVPSSAGGRLVAPGPLVAAGVLSSTATLEIEAYNVTAGPGQALPRVIFNGADIGALAAGTAGGWSRTTLSVPISTVNFPARRGPGLAPLGSANTLTLNVTAPGPHRCAALGWTLLSFMSLSPVIFVHGDGSDGLFFVRQGFAGALDTIGIPNDRSINLAGGGSATIAGNAIALDGLLPGIVTSFGVNSVHVVAHSKGGLDMRAWLGTFGTARAFRVISLTTLGTPHRGSALADAKLAVTSSWIGIPGLPAAVLVPLGFPGASAFDLSTFSTAFFNPPLPSGADYRMVGGDTDRIPDTLILRAPVDEYAAARAELGMTGTVLTDALATTAYQFMRNTRTVIVVPAVIPVPFFPFFIPAMVPAPLPNFVPTPNDLLVNLPSALGGPPPLVPAAVFIGATPPTNSRNHADIADRGVAGVVLPFLVATDTVRGDLR